MTIGELAFSPATAQDINAMWEIDKLCFEPEIAYTADVFYYHLLVNRDPAFVARGAGEKVVGFVLTAMEPRKKGTIVTIDILPEWRQKGVGSALMALAESALLKRGARKIVLQASVKNSAAISFYEKLGYKKTKTIKDYYVPGKHAFQFEKTV